MGANARTHCMCRPSTTERRLFRCCWLCMDGSARASGKKGWRTWIKVSDEHDFLVVYPDGLDRSWADGRGGTPADRNGVDDVKFLSALIDELEDEYKVDHTRIYATGMSNGGFMSGRLACELSEQNSGCGYCGGFPVGKRGWRLPSGRKPVSVVIMQGTADPVVPLARWRRSETRDAGG